MSKAFPVEETPKSLSCVGEEKKRLYSKLDHGDLSTLNTVAGPGGPCKPAHCLNNVQSAVGFLTLVVRTCDVRTVLVNFKMKLKIPPILNAAASVKA